MYHINIIKQIIHLEKFIKNYYKNNNQILIALHHFFSDNISVLN